MYLPIEIQDLDPKVVRSVLERFREHATSGIVSLEGRDLAAAMSLRRNRYIKAFPLSRTHATSGLSPQAFTSRGLTKDGESLLRLFDIEIW